ncbi:MAG: hypothetical protein M0Z41_12370 [Peptococcaceae bacterium]|jgi:hypothetical protein|nr:hypothetical protein [Peptococcaceae bacterium]
MAELQLVYGMMGWGFPGQADQPYTPSQAPGSVSGSVYGAVYGNQ